MNQRDRRARTIQHPNGARVTFVRLSGAQLLAQLLKWHREGTTIDWTDGQDGLLTLLLPPLPLLAEDDYVFLADSHHDEERPGDITFLSDVHGHFDMGR